MPPARGRCRAIGSELDAAAAALAAAAFAATTLDTAARIQRFCLAELGTSLRMPILRNRFVGTGLAVVPAALLVGI